MMNAMRTLSLLLPSMLILTACSVEPEPTPTETAVTDDEPASNLPTYTAVVDADYPPYGLRNEYGNASGFDVEVLEAIASHQDFAVDILPMSWESVLSSMDEATYPIVAGGILEVDIDNPKHLANYNFSTPYVYGQDAIATLPETQGITSFEDLPNYRVGVLSDSGHVELVKTLQSKGSGELMAADSTFLAYQALFLDEVDAVLADEGVLRYLQKQSPEAKVDIHHEGDRLSERFPMVYMVRKGDSELNQKIQSGIEQIVADGTYVDIYQKWFGVTPSVLPGDDIVIEETVSEETVLAN